MAIAWIQTNKKGGENKNPSCAEEGKLVDSYYDRDCVGVVVTKRKEYFYTVNPNDLGTFMAWASRTFGRDCPGTVELEKDGYNVVMTFPDYCEIAQGRFM